MRIFVFRHAPRARATMRHAWEEITQQSPRSQFSEQTSGHSTGSPNGRSRNFDAISPLKAAHVAQDCSRGLARRDCVGNWT
jgi:hypothetical protein